MLASAVGPGWWFGHEMYSRLHTWLHDPLPRNVYATCATGVGLLTALALAAMRMRFAWWPFHPVGYAVSGSWSMEQLWFPMFISWALKWTILHYGSAKAYRKAVPFFIGLVLGEFVIGNAWNIYGSIVGMDPYHFWPY
jgi:hypothetical protein